jgi:hypothetical protein
MEDVEVVVRCIPTSVVFECPYCEEENEYDYSEFCDLCDTRQIGIMKY